MMDIGAGVSCLNAASQVLPGNHANLGSLLILRVFACEVLLTFPRYSRLRGNLDAPALSQFFSHLQSLIPAFAELTKRGVAAMYIKFKYNLVSHWAARTENWPLCTGPY